MGRPSELDEQIYLLASVIAVSIKDTEENYFNRSVDNVLLRLAHEGKINWQGLPELGDILMEEYRPRGTSVFRESQGGLGDTILAAWVYDRARSLGLGREEISHEQHDQD